MAKIDGMDPSIFMNPSAYSGVKDEKKAKNLQASGLLSSKVRKGDKTDFSQIFSGLKADELGPLQSLPVSDESVNMLMDEVRDAGDKLLNRPLPEEIINYKQAVRNFINYIVKNAYTVDKERGIPKFLKPGFKGQRGTSDSMYQQPYTKIQVIDKKLEDLAAMLL
jgi:hypothetical protein